MAEFSGAIFDMDGTLLDSMPMWVNLGAEFLKHRGKAPQEDILARLEPLTMEEAAEYMIAEYHLGGTAEDVLKGMDELLADFYAAEVQLKPGAAEFLENLHVRGVRMCVATATDRHLVEAAFRRTRISHYFKDIFTCTEVGFSKRSAHIFEAALASLGTDKQDTVVFEDALYAIQTAKNAGFRVIAMADGYSLPQKKAIISLAEEYWEKF